MDSDIKIIVDIINNRPNLRSKESLANFVKFCLEWPELRFWQALRNWVGWGFVLVAQLNKDWFTLGQPPYDIKSVVDTYYWEKNHKIEDYKN